MIKRTKNKKVKNATKCEYGLISFKSKLELFCYKELIKVFGEDNVKYESTKFVLQEKFRFNGELIREITYTPDFLFSRSISHLQGLIHL